MLSLSTPENFFPEDHPRKCIECNRSGYDTRTRINLTGTPDLCEPCNEDLEVRAAYGSPV